MKAPRHILTLSLTIAVIPLFIASGLRSESVAMNSVVGTYSVPLSVFESKLPNGRDPFFPHSVRRAVEASPAGPSAVAPTSLLLQGLSHAAGRPLATINNQTFTPGEEGEVTIPGGHLRIRCEQIKADSVVISTSAGQRLELKLRQ